MLCVNNTAKGVSENVGVGVNVSESLETLQAIAAGENIEALILEADYKGPTALLRDAAGWLVGRKEWRKAFRLVLDAAGWRE